METMETPHDGLRQNHQETIEEVDHDRITGP